ncbi:MAG: hypothetical protein WCO56_24780 [Verrucomicrobiota bacterium]
MPEPVSATIGITLAGYTFLNAYARGSSATSYEARMAQDAATAVVESFEHSQALFGEKSDAISRLNCVARDCSTQDWDGNGANAINPLSIMIAEQFVRMLPDGMPLPDFSPDPDGSISLDWIQSRNRLFSLSIGNSSRLAYAWLDGADKGHGVALFDGETIPRRVLEGITAIISHGQSTLRAA